MQKRDVVAFGKFNRSREYVFNLLIVREERDITTREIPVKFLMNLKSFNRKEKDEKKMRLSRILHLTQLQYGIRYHVRKKLMQ